MTYHESDKKQKRDKDYRVIKIIKSWNQSSKIISNIDFISYGPIRMCSIIQL